jgi:hypothetical protein
MNKQLRNLKLSSIIYICIRVENTCTIVYHTLNIIFFTSTVMYTKIQEGWIRQMKCEGDSVETRGS